MPDMALLFSFLFFLAFLIYLYWGINIIRLDPKQGINKAFFFLSMALCIWSFGYALSNSATNIETALFWRRVGSIGRMYLFSIILHFLILLTRSKDPKYNKWPPVLVYIPAIILVYVFSLSNSLAPMQYNLMRIHYGWLDKPVDNLWNKIYYLYFIIYMLTSLVLLMRWKRKIKDKEITKQANLILKTISVGILFGGLLDILPNLVVTQPVPQLSSIFILLPVGAMYRAARDYNVFQIDIPPKSEVIVTEEERKNIFRNISVAFYIAAILAFISEYIPYINEANAFIFALLKALTLVGIGIVIHLIQNISKESIREKLTILVLIVSIPMGILQYTKYGGLTVWAFPLVIMIASIVFSKLTLLVLTTVVAISTQVLIWGINPETRVVIDRFDYILRIGMFIVAFFTGLYINRIYVAKIKENKQQYSFQKMISDVLFEFVDINQENFHTKVQYLLEKIGVFFSVDRTYLFTIDDQTNTMTYSNEWCNTGIKEAIASIEEVNLDAFPWWVDQLTKKNLVYIENVDLMPEEARKEEKQLRQQEVKSLITVAIMGEDRMLAFIGIDSVLKPKEWTQESIDMLNIMASILSRGIAQIKADNEIEFMAYYDNLTKLPNRFLFEDRVNQAIHLSKSTGNGLAIIFIDLDNFKAVNDTIGHKGGDDLLKQVAKDLTSAASKTDTVARFGGDEFMIMANNITDHGIITDLADKVMEVFSDLFIVSGQEFLITASAGIALYPSDGEDSASLVKNADMAMYEAKARGKNQYVFCSKAI